MRSYSHVFGWYVSSGLLVAAMVSRACIWDADTLAAEKKKSPDMASLILNLNRASPNTNALLKKIESLKSSPRQSDPAWWNDLAGAYLRLGNANEAANLLEPLLSKFPNDYGIHANLGTAYHLLGRYQDAERHIARDLELNTNAHFGLEVYHLALLQYLSRDQEYQSRHAYIDEFTPVLLGEHQIIRPHVSADLAVLIPSSTVEEINQIKQTLAQVSPTNRPLRGEYLLMLASTDPVPPYRTRWNLAHNPNFIKGVRYMAELNSSQPACFVMLGLACLNADDLNLAARAFQRAIALGSPQSKVLEDRIAEIDEHIQKAKSHRGGWALPISAAVFIALVILYFLFRFLRRFFSPSTAPPNA